MINKKYVFSILLSFFIKTVSQAQSLSVNELVALSNTMTATYESRPAEINGIIDAYLLKGFILDEFKRFNTTLTNTSTTYASFINNNNVNNEQFEVRTDVIPPQGSYPERKTCTIEFYTSDFPTFANWFREISTNTATFTLVMHGHVFHRYTSGIRIVEVGETALHPAPAAGQSVSENWKFDASTVRRFYLLIQYPVNI